MCLMFAASLLGCASGEGGTFDLRITAVDGPIGGTYTIDWDGDVTWTREVGCDLDEGWSDTSYTVDANDRSLGELVVGLIVQSYDGPGVYDRDEFQPSPALAIDWTDEETGGKWHLGTDSGGRCSITVDEASRSGAFQCVDVAVFRDELRTEDLASVDGSWVCAEVERSDLLSARSSRPERGPSL